jgi:hypothetical protein
MAKPLLVRETRQFWPTLPKEKPSYRGLSFAKRVGGNARLKGRLNRGQHCDVSKHGTPVARGFARDFRGGRRFGLKRLFLKGRALEAPAFSEVVKALPVPH